MDVFFLALSITMLLFFTGLNWGKDEGAKLMRDKVVVYCIEKSQLCEEEYHNIKTQTKLNNYQRPEIVN